METTNGMAYSRIPPLHELTVKFGEFWVVHSRTYYSERSGSGVKPEIIKILSYNAVVVNAQQDPHCP